MTEIAAAATEEDRAFWRDQVETLAISICRIKQLPEPDGPTLQRIVSKAMAMLDGSPFSAGRSLPDAVVEAVAAAFA